MKFPKLTALLALSEIVFHNNFWNGGKEHARFGAEELQKIEDGLNKTGTAEDAQIIADLQSQVSGFEANENSVQEAVSAAMKLNGLEMTEGQTVADAISALGKKCKEYGDSKATHTIPPSNGIENPKGEEDPSENYAHNKVFDESKYATLT